MKRFPYAKKERLYFLVFRLHLHILFTGKVEVGLILGWLEHLLPLPPSPFLPPSSPFFFMPGQNLHIFRISYEGKRKVERKPFLLPEKEQSGNLDRLNYCSTFFFFSGVYFWESNLASAAAGGCAF